MYNQVCQNDLEAALLFFTSLTEDSRGIVIQCNGSEGIPYIRHNIKCLLGTPDRIIDNLIFYDRRPITLLPLKEYETNTSKYNDDILFYVDVKDVVPDYDDIEISSDISKPMGNIFKSLSLHPKDIVSSMIDMNMPVVDVAKNLVRLCKSN